ncbi:hypothetical protein D9M70_490980 [compost metagenome]
MRKFAIVRVLQPMKHQRAKQDLATCVLRALLFSEPSFERLLALFQFGEAL